MAHWRMRGAARVIGCAACSSAVSAVLAVTADTGPGLAIVPRRRSAGSAIAVHQAGSPAQCTAVRHWAGEEERVMRTTWV